MANFLQPEYANIKFEFSEWDVLENQEVYWENFFVDSHTCSEEELGLTGDNSKFMPIHETSIDYVNLYKNEFLCVN